MRKSYDGNVNGESWNKMLSFTEKILNSAKSYNIEKIANEMVKCIPEYYPNLNAINRKIKIYNK